MRAREYIAGVLAAVCIAPSVLCNVLPHLTAALAGETPAMVMATFQGVSVLVIAYAPFALKKTSNIMMKFMVMAGLTVLLWLSFVNAIDLAGLVRESATGVARGSLAKGAALNSRITENQNSRKQLPPFDWTTPAQVSTAKTAVENAEVARDKECAKVGDKCRQRQNEAAEAVEKLAKVEAARGLTTRAETLDSELKDMRKQLDALGPLPQHADSSAVRIAHVLSFVMKYNDENVTEWRPVWFAMGLEILAFIGPFIMFTGFMPDSSRTVAEKQQPRIWGTVKIPLLHRGRELTPAVTHAAVSETPATPAKAKPTKKIKAVTATGVSPARQFGDVLDWYNSRKTDRAGHEIRVQDCMADYVQWCHASGKEAYSLTKFGIEMRDAVKVEKVERSKRSYYVGFALKAGALKVVKSV